MSPSEGSPVLEPWLLELLRCPVTGARLQLRQTDGGEAQLVSEHPDRPLAYPIRQGVPVLLADEAVDLT